MIPVYYENAFMLTITTNAENALSMIDITSQFHVKILVIKYDHSHLMIYSIPLAADSTSFSDSAMLPIVSLTTLGEKYVIYS